MKLIIFVALGCFGFSLGRATDSLSQPSVNWANRVDPRIGIVAGKGTTVIGPTLPNGSVHPSPDTADGGHSGYNPDRPIRGFSQLHASGIGWGRYGNILVSPQIDLNLKADGHDSPKSNEKAAAYSYEVRMARYNIFTEIAPTRHAAIYRITYPDSDKAYLMLDLAHQIPGQTAPAIQDSAVTDSVIQTEPDMMSFSGSSKYQGGWGGGSYTVYFYAEIDRVPSAVGTWKNEEPSAQNSRQTWTTPGDRIGGWWRLDTKAGQPVQFRIGISFLSVEQAKASLRREIPDWDFDGVKAAAAKAWNDNFGHVAVTGGTDEQQTLFYTALYHAQIMPRDRTGEFARFPSNTPMWDDHYALWDTWRTKYPLMLLIQPDMVRGTIASFVERLHADAQVRDTFTAGWGGPGSEKDQGGNDVDNVIADAYVKGLKGVDWKKAYEVLKHDADSERKGNFEAGAQDYRSRGWIRAGQMAVSNTLEYAYNDFSVAQVAKGLGKKKDAARYFNRARQWQYLFNLESVSDGFKGFVVPRNLDGTWVPWDPKFDPGSWKPNYYESNSWTYSYFVPHQVARLVKLTGGANAFVKKLEYAHEQALIGFGNEPAFLAPFLFHYAGRPDLSSQWLRRLCRANFTTEGYPGDDDSGAMSSYYVWSCLGLFPNAGQDLYFLDGPTFDRIVITRPDEGRLEITREGEGDYIAGVTLNGKPLDRSWVHHAELKGDTLLAFTMSSTPTKWGTGELPPSDATAIAVKP